MTKPNAARNSFPISRDRGLRLEPLEIKAGQTVTSDSFSGLRKWTALAGKTVGRAKLVYAGDEYQERQDVDVIPWHKVARVSEACGANAG